MSQITAVELQGLADQFAQVVAKQQDEIEILRKHLEEVMAQNKTLTVRIEKLEAQATQQSPVVVTTQQPVVVTTQQPAAPQDFWASVKSFRKNP